MKQCDNPVTFSGIPLGFEEVRKIGSDSSLVGSGVQPVCCSKALEVPAERLRYSFTWLKTGQHGSLLSSSFQLQCGQLGS